MKFILSLTFIFSLLFTLQAQDTDKMSQPDLKGDLMLDFGFNYWNMKLAELPLKVRGSNSISIYYNRRLEISRHLSFHPAIGLTVDKYAFKGNHTWGKRGWQNCSGFYRSLQDQ